MYAVDRVQGRLQSLYAWHGRRVVAASLDFVHFYEDDSLSRHIEKERGSMDFRSCQGSGTVINFFVPMARQIREEIVDVA